MALAQGSNQAESIEIFNAALTAHGGLAAIARITDTTAVGQLRTYKADGTYEQQSYTIKTRGFDQLRTEINNADLYITNGSVGWVRKKDEKKRLDFYEVTNNIVRLNPVAGLLGAYRQNRFQVAYESLVYLEGKQYHRITLTHPQITPNMYVFSEVEWFKK